MTNQSEQTHNGFLDALRTTRDQVQALEAQYNQMAKEMQEQVKQLSHELDALKQQRDQLQDQVAQLRQELDDSRSEADIYRHSLHTMLRRKFTFTKEELLEVEQNKVSFEDIMEELNRL
jgi:uncharacterized coiled-coil DUF342 family protein